MGDNKTVKFGGDVSGLKGAMMEADKINKDYYKNVLNEATKLSLSTKQQTEYIKLQTKATQANMAALRQEQETLIKTFEIEKRRIEKATSSGSISKTAGAAQIKGLNKGLNKELGASDVRIKDLDKVVEGLKSVKEEISLTAMKEMAADKEGVIKQVSEFRKAAAEDDADSLSSKYSPEEILKLSQQSEMLGQKSPETQQQQSMFGAILGAEMVKGLVGKISQVGGAMAGAESGEQFFADALKGIPIIGDALGGAVGRSQNESYAAQTGMHGLRGRMGGKTRMFSAQNMGYSIAETMPIAEQVVTALGSGEGYKKNTKDFMGAERAFSLDRGTLTEMLKNQRMQDGGDLGTNVSTVYNTMKEKGFISEGDTTQFQEILQLQNSLVSKQSEVMETTDPNVATGIISAFKEVGGSFGDARAGGRIQQISGALAGPGNDFQQARNMQVLSKMNPGGSMFEMMEMQEKGISQEGFLSETLKQLEKETGGGEGMLMATKARLGLGAGATRKLVEQFQADPTTFDDFAGSNDELTDKLDLQKMGSRNTSKRDKQKAAVSDAFVSGAGAGMLEVGRQFAVEVGGVMKEYGGSIGEEIGNGIINTMQGKEANFSMSKALGIEMPSFFGNDTVDS